MEVWVKLSGSVPVSGLRERVRTWAGCGVTGMVVGDHLFDPGTGDQRRAEPHVLLAAAGALSDGLAPPGGLALATVVGNYTVRHPVHPLRAIAQLAGLYGGERVHAGFGAGWNATEYAAVGRALPPLAERLDRLERVLVLARALFDGEPGDDPDPLDPSRALPLSPTPGGAPRILVGGGSDRILELAARHADALDLNTPSGVEPTSASLDPKRARDSDTRRRLRTTPDALRDLAARFRARCAEAGRPDRVPTSAVLSTARICPPQERRDRERDAAAAVGLDDVSFDDCAFTLVGTVDELAATATARYADGHLDRLIVPDSPDLPRLCREVLAPLLTSEPAPTTDRKEHS